MTLSRLLTGIGLSAFAICSATLAQAETHQAPIATNTTSPLIIAPGGTGALTIQNKSATEIAYDISANLAGTDLNGKVIENASNCAKVNPGASCTLKFTAGRQLVPATDFTVQGSKTSTVNANIAVAVPHVIFVTDSSYNGDLEGLAGANDKCNNDHNKPLGYASTYQYKALLAGNNATVAGVDYYRVDGTTKIATATGPELVGNNSVLTAVSDSKNAVWTGAMNTNCSDWTSANSFNLAGWGSASYSNSRYYSESLSTCEVTKKLYCVSQ
jgi:hypothetical protein